MQRIPFPLCGKLQTGWSWREERNTIQQRASVPREPQPGEGLPWGFTNCGMKVKEAAGAEKRNAQFQEMFLSSFECLALKDINPIHG